MDKASEEQNLTPLQDGNHTRILSEIYYDLQDPISYSSSPYALLKKAKQKDASITLEQVKKWLRKQVSHTRHTQRSYQFPRRKILSLRIDDTWSGDLIQCDILKNYNAGYQYILNCVDLFSRKKWLRKLKSKSQKEMELAMKSIIAENNGRAPFRFWTDRGTEFLSLKKLYEEHEIHRYSTNSPLKSVFVENANKAVENLLYKVMTSLNTAKWINLLDDVAKHLNETKSKTLFNLTPNEAHLKVNEEYLRSKYLERYKQYKEKFKRQRARFVPGDTVRILRDKTKFSRGYEPAFSKELYVIEAVQKTYPLTYKLKGQRRVYYSQELVHAEAPVKDEEKNYFIERTRRVNTRKSRSGAITGGQTEYLLKAKNDPEQSGWISEFEYQKLKDGGLIMG